MNATREKIYGLLIGIISDGFNRSIGALQDAKALSKYYDLVTAQIELTARIGAKAIENALSDGSDQTR
jgi:hypothetical protein